MTLFVSFFIYLLSSFISLHYQFVPRDIAVELPKSAANRIASALPKLVLEGLKCFVCFQCVDVFYTFFVAGLGSVNAILRALPDVRKFFLGAIKVYLRSFVFLCFFVLNSMIY